MKIVLIRNLNPFFESSASGNRFSSLVKGLVDNGVEVTIIVTGGFDNFAEYKAKEIEIKGVKIYYTINIFSNNIWLRRINKYLLSKFIKKVSNFRLKKYLSSFDYDYLWLTKDIDILKFFISNKNKIDYKKSLIELNEFNDIHKLEGQFRYNFQKKLALKDDEIFFQAIKKIDCFAVMTKTLIDYYSERASDKAVFFHLPMTVDVERFTLQKEAIFEKSYVAFTGTYTNLKDGVDILIRSFAEIADKYPKLKLILAGFYHWDMESQKEIIKKFHLEDRVKYVGILNKEQIPAFIQNAELLVLSRPDSHQAQGGFPTKLGEYLATGNPVCVTKVGEIPDYLDDEVSAYMAEPGSVVSFADAMDRALGDKEKAKRVGTKGKEVALQNFDIKVQGKRFVEFLENNL